MPDPKRTLCPRTCIDCCCEPHHWGEYGDEEGLSCKHCSAVLPYVEVCVRCEAELIDHDGMDCPEGGGQFRYEGEPARNCQGPHPWDTSADEEESDL